MIRLIDPDTKKVVLAPKIVGHKNTPLRILPFNRLYANYRNHVRLHVFVHKGLQCTFTGCKCIAKYLVLTRDPGGGKHLDLYTKDFQLMTIDHRIAKSNGGSNKLENLFPMCSTHNGLKANKPYIP